MINKLAMNSFSGDQSFKFILLSSAAFILMLVAGIVITLYYYSSLSLSTFGLEFITGSTWDPVSGEYGILPFLIGTLLTSIIALVISFPLSLIITIFIGEYFTTGMPNTLMRGAVELLAGIPSIIYGFWGLFVLVPIVREFQILFDIAPYGVGIFTSAIVLAIMIIPYSASIGYEVIGLVPKELKEAAYSLGATRYEVIKNVTLSYSGSGITAGVLLSFGRALGETMAVTMVIGNSNLLPGSIFGPGNTMASLIANEFTEAANELYLSALFETGLILFIVTAVINILGKIIIKKFVSGTK